MCVCECHLMLSYGFVFSAELLSSNKKYGVKQRQYKLFAGEFGYFDTDQAHHLYLFPGLFIVWLCGLCFIKGGGEMGFMECLILKIVHSVIYLKSIVCGRELKCCAVWRQPNSSERQAHI